MKKKKKKKKKKQMCVNVTKAFFFEEKSLIQKRFVLQSITSIRLGGLYIFYFQERSLM